jgi:hypothetical protein
MRIVSASLNQRLESPAVRASVEVVAQYPSTFVDHIFLNYNRKILKEVDINPTQPLTAAADAERVAERGRRGRAISRPSSRRSILNRSR